MSAIHDNQSDRMTVLVDLETGHAITWNGSLTFNVWTVSGEPARLQREVDVFTAGEVPESDLEAADVAEDWG